jgi:hypothetical protein
MSGNRSSNGTPWNLHLQQAFEQRPEVLRINTPSKSADRDDQVNSRAMESTSFQDAARTLFARLAHHSPPAPLRPAAPEPINRYWPALTGALPLPGVGISLRHPACTFAFQDVQARKIGRSPRSSTRGSQRRFPSMKMERQMRANSGPEFAHLLRCELNRHALKFVEQPAWLTYIEDGHQRKHKGDALLLTSAGLEWREIKYEAEASLPENEARWDCIGPALASLGISFNVVTERHIYERVQWLNVRMIWENRLAPVPAESDRNAIINAIDRGTITTISQLMTTCSLEMCTVLALIRRGFLAIDLDKPISGETDVLRGAGLRSAVGSRIYKP